MAETTNNNTNTTTNAEPKAKPAARRSNARRAPSSKAPSKSTGRRQRTIAKNETRDAAQAQARAARTTAAQGRNVAERAALVYVGATLEARDRVLGLAGEFVNRYGTRSAAEREVNKDIRRFERRGERDVKKARTRLERAVRTRRRDAERLLRRNRRTVEHQVDMAERQTARQPNPVASRIADVSTRVEDAAQFSVATGTRIASVAKDRVTALV
ncbi:MAG: hypothetical protein ACRDPU_10370 [Thermoleophilia bacterium]